MTDPLDGDGAVLDQTSALQAPAGISEPSPPSSRAAATMVAGLGRLGRYTLQQPLGKGGMAEVFLAVQDGPAGFQKQVVVKKSDPELAKNPKFVEMFLREAKIAARLNHSNIVQVFELGQENDTYFIAMEHIDGISLQKAARRAWSIGESIPMEVIVKCVADAARGLHYAHTWKSADGKIAGLVHRDISPDNLMLTRDGVTKVLDFGIAKMAIDEDEPVTKTGEIKGKIPYMPPEQLRGVPLDGRADLWSLGVTLYWLLTGARPFAGNEIQTLQAILHDEPVPPRQVNPLVPVPLERLTMRLLQKDRDRRFASGQEVADALLTLLGPGASANTASEFAERMMALDDQNRPGASSTQAGSQSVQTVVAAKPHTEWLMKAAPSDSPSQEMWREAITGATDSGKIAPPPPPPLSMPAGQLAASGNGAPPPPLTGANALGGANTKDGHGAVDVDISATGLITDEAVAQATPANGGGSKMVAFGVAAAGLIAILGAVAVVALREDPAPTLTPPTAVDTEQLAAKVAEKLAAEQAQKAAAEKAAVEQAEKLAAEKLAAEALAAEKAATETDTKTDTKAATDASGSTTTKPAEPAVVVKKTPTIAPAGIRWETTRGKLLGKGDGGVALPAGTTSLVAVDPATGGRTTVKLSGGRFDYSAIKQGQLAVRAQPYAAVKLGPRSLGNTPFAPVKLVAGTYKVVLTYEGKDVERTVTIAEGREASVAVNMLKEAP